jgi:hypothetical protein
MSDKVGIDADIPLPPPRKGRPRAAPKTESIETLVIEIRGLMLNVTVAERDLNKKRLSAGQRLLELRARIEAGEAGDVSWWPWAEEHIQRSRRDMEKVMAIAMAPDPEAAAETERERNRHYKAAQRNRAADVSRSPEHEKARSPGHEKATDITLMTHSSEVLSVLAHMSKLMDENEPSEKIAVLVTKRMLEAARRAETVANKARKFTKDHSFIRQVQ